MTTRHRPIGSVVPFGRRWHVVHEIDLVRLMADHEHLARLCDRLEACADALPTLPDRSTMEQLCRELLRFAERVEGADEMALGSMFGRAPDNHLVAALTSRVSARRAADAAHALDLIAALRPGSEHDRRVSPDALGYMLRCFFAGCRRAMDLEELAVIAFAQHRLTPDARELLARSLRHRPA